MTKLESTFNSLSACYFQLCAFSLNNYTTSQIHFLVWDFFLRQKKSSIIGVPRESWIDIIDNNLC